LLGNFHRAGTTFTAETVETFLILSDFVVHSL
jgi:hypothetical protein